MMQSRLKLARRRMSAIGRSLAKSAAQLIRCHCLQDSGMRRGIGTICALFGCNPRWKAGSSVPILNDTEIDLRSQVKGHSDGA
jgi:hypothetical protein